MLLTLLGDPIFSKLVSYMTEGSMLLTLLGDRPFFQVGRQGTRGGVDVTNSAWGPTFFQVGRQGIRGGVDVTNSAWAPIFFSKLVDKEPAEGSMLLTLLGGRFFFQVGLRHGGWGRCY
jgi:hypothetical protein